MGTFGLLELQTKSGLCGESFQSFFILFDKEFVPGVELEISNLFQVSE
jgi:hypothetical protein